MNWTAVGSIGTAIAVLVAAWQVRRNTQQATTNFEDDLSREYRELTRGIPVQARLGRDLSDESFQEIFPRLFQYIDLSNEQVFLRQMGRVSRSTWHQWSEGIKQNLAQPVFARAWAEIKTTSPDRFDELRRLESSAFREDPRQWPTMRDKLRQYLSL